MQTDERVSRLERIVRRQRWWLLALFVVALAGMVRRPKPIPLPSTILAQRLVVVDPQGQERIVLVAHDTVPRIEFRDPMGDIRSQWDLAPSGPGLTMLDRQGQVAVLLAVGQEGPFLGLTDSGGHDVFTAPPAASNQPAAAASDEGT